MTDPIDLARYEPLLDMFDGQVLWES
jgi:hypothetical protein